MLSTQEITTIKEEALKLSCGYDNSHTSYLSLSKDRLVEWGKKRGLTFLGQGVFRAVFRCKKDNFLHLPKGNIIKIPKSDCGANQNIAEKYLFDSLFKTNMVPQCFNLHIYEGMPIIECEFLHKVSKDINDRFNDVGYERWNQMRALLYSIDIHDWLQVGYSKSRGIWVLSDLGGT